MSEVIDRGLDHSGFLPKNKQPLVIFIILTYTLLMSYFGRFSGYDEPFFKGAGREWGTTGRFAATELADSDWYPTTSFKVDVKPEEVFFFYPPLYSLGFGLIVKLFGFGWRQCVFYDAFIRAVLAYAFVQIAHQMSVGKRRDWLITLLSFAILLQGFSERPDDLATCLAMIGLLPLIGLSTNRSQIILSGISFGLCAGTSVGAAGMLAMIAITLLLSNSTPWQVRIRDFAIWCSVSAAVFLMVVFPLLYLHPGAINQYRANAATAIKSYPSQRCSPSRAMPVIDSSNLKGTWQACIGLVPTWHRAWFEFTALLVDMSAATCTVVKSWSKEMRMAGSELKCTRASFTSKGTPATWWEPPIEAQSKG